MKKDQIKKASDFLGLKKLSPLEDKAIRGGIITVHQDQDQHQGAHHVQHHVHQP